MRGGKEEGKVTSPMFPRLHVNDKEKGGPRAPPRNKMALYEQLSIPFQRYSSGSAPMLPLPPPDGTSLVSSMSSSNGGHERSMFTQLYNSPAPSFSAEKLHSYSSNGIKLSNMMANQERNYQCLNATAPLSSNGKSSSFKPSNFSNFRHFSLRKPGDEDDLRVSSARLGIAPHCSNSQQSKDRKFKQKKGSALGDSKSGPCVRNQNDENTSQTSLDPVDNYTSIALNRDRNLADASSIHSSKVHPQSLKRAHSSLNQENKSSSMETLNRLHITNSRLHQERVALRDEVAHTDGLLVETARDIDKDNAFTVRTESSFRPLLGDDNSSPKELENVECHEDKNERPVQVREVDKQDNVSNTHMVDSVSALGVSPDDVVGVIGEKQFWKARRAIIDQQRVFALQVFELHRLMKVQRLIARSPSLLLEDNLCVGKPTLNTPQAKKLRSESVLKPLPCIVKAKNDSPNLDPGTECADDNAVANIQRPFINNDTSKGFVTQQSNNGSCSGNVPPAPRANSRNIKQTPWCFPPPGNQWLVSVMSPSEGLVYKPYTGPCPSTTGFVAPFYGSCGPVSLNPTGADFLNTVYGVPASHQEGIGILPTTPPLGQTGLPPYGMPVMNQSISGTAVDQMIPFPARGQSKDNHLSMLDINFVIPHQSSCNMSSQMSRVISSCLEKFQASKESEVQASTASSPSERAKVDALPLFPMVPIVQASDQNDQTGEQQPRVIKVVPCNPRLATESAARIFRSIQEERKQYD